MDASELDIEEELKAELEKLDQIFSTNNLDFFDEEIPLPPDEDIPNSQRKSRMSQSAYELAQAEIEKEELQDKLHILISKTEEYNKQIFELNEENLIMKRKNEQLNRENEDLKSQLEELEARVASNEKTGPDSNIPRSVNSIDMDYSELEFKYAEVKSRLAKSQQQNEDLTMTRDALLAECEREKFLRQKADREKDAYSTAYQASVQQIEKWSKFRNYLFRSSKGSDVPASATTTPTKA